jgi:hypothetical protein
MARQPIENLQGYGQTSSPSAAPVDSFTGAPSVPRETPATQLAQALGTMSSAVAKAGARAKAEREELSAKKAQGYAASFKGEQGEFLDSVKLGETYADLSQTVVATIVEDKYKNEYFNATFERLNKLDDDVKGDVVALENLFEGIITEANEATQGMDFVNSGAVQGARNAINQMRREFSEFRDTETRNLAKANTEANVYNILGKVDLSTNDGQVSAVALVNDFNEKLIATSPFSKTEDKQQIVDALISYNKLNPTSNAVSLIKKVPWLQSKVTDKKLAEASPLIANEAIVEMELENKRLEVQLKNRKVDLEVEIDNLLVSGNRQKVRKMLTKSIPGEASDLDKLTAQYAKEYARVALARENADPEASNLRFNELREDIKTAASTGNWSGMGFTETPNNDQIRELIGKDETLTQQDAAVLRNNLSDLRKGFATISDEALANDVSKKFSLDLQYFNTDVPKSMLGAAGMSAQRVMEDAYSDSMQEQFTEFYNNPNYETGVPEGDVLKEMKATAFAEVEAVVTKLNTILTAEGNKIENLKGFNQVLTQGEQPDIELEVGKEYPSPDGGFVRYLGGDPEYNSSFEKVGEEGNPAYKVTRKADALKGSARQQKAQTKKNKEAKENVSNILNEDTATFDLTEDTLSKLTRLVEGRYKRASKRKQNVSEDSIMEIVLDQLGLDGVSDFEYGGMFGDEADTAGEVAIKKIVDSLMEKHKGE